MAAAAFGTKEEVEEAGDCDEDDMRTESAPPFGFPAGSKKGAPIQVVAVVVTMNFWREIATVAFMCSVSLHEELIKLGLLSLVTVERMIGSCEFGNIIGPGI